MDTQIIEPYTIKGLTMDDEHLKKDGTILGEKYFEEQLQRIREIRQSATTQRFFSTVQNKLHWAIHGQTAAELISHRADAGKQNMGLTSWKDALHGKIQQFDVIVAKNYLNEAEMAQLQRLVSAYLDLAEDMAARQIPRSQRI